MFRIYRDVRFSRTRAHTRRRPPLSSATRWASRPTLPASTSTWRPTRCLPESGCCGPTPRHWGRIRTASHRIPRGGTARPRTVLPRRLRGDRQLAEAPAQGFDADHPGIEDLKRKDHIAACTFVEEEATSPGFLDDFADACRMASPYMEFLTTAVGLPY